MATGNWRSGELSPARLIRRMVQEQVRSRTAHALRRYWPEILANLGLAAYTAVRTAAVAVGVDPVARTDWRIFLAIELITQVPYTWGIGYLIRDVLRPRGSVSGRAIATFAVATAFLAPYAYLLANGGVDVIESGLVTGVMILVGVYFLLKGLRRIRRSDQAKAVDAVL